MTNSNRMVILYGSQTFTAQEVSEKIWRKTKILNLRGPVQAMDEYPIEKLVQEQYVVFVCSTTGDGVEPDNMKSFWKFLLKKSLPHNSLTNLKFGVLALGDSSYSKFNFAGKKLHKRLLQLGATALLDIGLCDFQHDLGHDAVIEPWLNDLWKKLNVYFPEIQFDANINDEFIPRWNLELMKGTNNETYDKQCNKDIYFKGENINKLYCSPLKMKLTENSRTTAESHFQNVRLLEFKMNDGTPFMFHPGDVMNLRPRNSRESINELFEILNSHNIDVKPHYKLSVTQIYDDMPVPEFLRESLTMYDVAEQYWDLNAVPGKYVFQLLAFVSQDKLEKEKCLEFCTAEGQEDWLNYCKRPKRTILEVFSDFRNSVSKLTIDVLFEMIPTIKPRSFSIASSCQYSKGAKLEILVAIVQYFTNLKKERLGLCSNWLKSLPTGSILYGWIKKGTFQFPSDTNTPCIMIGPGTGLAPFRSYILERDSLKTASKDNLVLIFGCRNQNADFHCSVDLLRLQKEEKLELICAFSRDQDEKIYVQHKIAEHQDLLWKLIYEKKAVIMIAGNAKNMPDNVKDAFLEDVLQGAGKLGKEEATELLKIMEKHSRLQLETW